MVLSSFRVSEREKKSSKRPSTFMEVALKKFYSASRQPYQLQNARRNVNAHAKNIPLVWPPQLCTK